VTKVAGTPPRINAETFSDDAPAARIDDEQLGNQRGRNLQGGTMVKSPGMTLANGVTLWDELPGAVTPTPRPQQLSNGVNNVQVTRVTYTTR
jgi:hypothetical protein